MRYLVSNKARPAKRKHLDKVITAVETLTRDLTPRRIMNSGLVDKIYWGFNFGETIIVEWPKKQDPNNEWRTWLEKNVGRQGFDWHWKVDYTKAKSSGFQIKIKFRKKVYASMFVLLFGLT